MFRARTSVLLGYFILGLALWVAQALDGAAERAAEAAAEAVVPSEFEVPPAARKTSSVFSAPCEDQELWLEYVLTNETSRVASTRGILTLTNNRQAEKVTNLLVTFGYPSEDVRITDIRGAVMIDDDETDGTIDVANTGSTATLAPGGSAQISFQIVDRTSSAFFLSSDTISRLDLDNVAVNGASCETHSSTFQPGVDCRSTLDGCRQHLCCGAKIDAGPPKSLTQGPVFETVEVVYDDRLGPGWYDCSYRGQFFVQGPGWVINTFAGDAAVAANLLEGGALSFCADHAPMRGDEAAAATSALRFWVVGTSALAAVQLVLSRESFAAANATNLPVNASAASRRIGVPSPGGFATVGEYSQSDVAPSAFWARPLSEYGTVSRSEWTQVVVPLASVTPASLAARFNRISFLDNLGLQPMFLLDDLSIVADITSAESPRAEASSTAVFDDALAAGWRSCSWGATVVDQWVAQVYSGEASLGAQLAPQGGLSLCASQPFGPAFGHDTLQFSILGGARLANAYLSLSFNATASDGDVGRIQAAVRCAQVALDCADGAGVTAIHLAALGPIAESSWSVLTLNLTAAAAAASSQLESGWNRITISEPTGLAPALALDDIRLVSKQSGMAADRGGEQLPAAKPIFDLPLGPSTTEAPSAVAPGAEPAGPAAGLPAPVGPLPPAVPTGAPDRAPEVQEAAEGRRAVVSTWVYVVGSVFLAIVLGGAGILVVRAVRRNRELTQRIGTAPGDRGASATPVSDEYRQALRTEVNSTAVEFDGSARGPRPWSSRGPSPRGGGVPLPRHRGLASPPSGPGDPFGTHGTLYAGSRPTSTAHRHSSRHHDSSAPSRDCATGDTLRAPSQLAAVLREGGAGVSHEAVAIAQRLMANPVCVEVDEGEVSFTDNELLGSGGFGCVYAGHWRGRSVAIKVLFGIYEPAQREYLDFLREVEILVNATEKRHPRVVQFLGACFRPPQVFVVAELATGGSLASRLHGPSGSGALPYGEALVVACDVAEAMMSLHPNVVHRDLKPHNVLLFEGARAKVADFGVSRLKDRTYLSTQHVHVGTVQYMAPEIFTDEPIDEKCDVFSFGILLWEALTGLKPYGVLEGIQVIYRMSTGWRHQVPDSCPAPIRRLIEACWAQDPAARPRFCEILRVLEAELRSLGIVRPPDGPVTQHRAPRRPSRHNGVRPGGASTGGASSSSRMSLWSLPTERAKARMALSVVGPRPDNNVYWPRGQCPRSVSAPHPRIYAALAKPHLHVSRSQPALAPPATPHSPPMFYRADSSGASSRATGATPASGPQRRAALPHTPWPRSGSLGSRRAGASRQLSSLVDGSLPPSDVMFDVSRLTEGSGGTL
ncbi:unnamed protein product [Pedinophyceae sp. YPF-701]|nr:unnamed protein product [Pedinophyceae sp. YPF-701]